MKTINDGGYVFEVVNEFPNGYKVWAIGRENFKHERFIPLCEVDEYYNINPDSLKCLEVESEALALVILKQAVKTGVNKSKFNKIVNA